MDLLWLQEYWRCTLSTVIAPTKPPALENEVVVGLGFRRYRQWIQQLVENLPPLSVDLLLAWISSGGSLYGINLFGTGTIMAWKDEEQQNLKDAYRYSEDPPYLIRSQGVDWGGNNAMKEGRHWSKIVSNAWFNKLNWFEKSMPVQHKSY
jgi:hypothetical protein